ncbi:hypothetical protein TSAR_010374, partial [Trichomalopsis sarcophagae]
MGPLSSTFSKKVIHYNDKRCGISPLNLKIFSASNFATTRKYTSSVPEENLSVLSTQGDA